MKVGRVYFPNQLAMDDEYLYLTMKSMAEPYSVVVFKKETLEKVREIPSPSATAGGRRREEREVVTVDDEDELEMMDEGGEGGKQKAASPSSFVWTTLASLAVDESRIYLMDD